MSPRKETNPFDPSREAEPGDSSNAGQRADRGEAAIAAWRGADGEDESNIRDAICDILHYCHKLGDDPVGQAECALAMWRDESHNPA